MIIKLFASFRGDMFSLLLPAKKLNCHERIPLVVFAVLVMCAMSKKAERVAVCEASGRRQEKNRKSTIFADSLRFPILQVFVFVFYVRRCDKRKIIAIIYDDVFFSFSPRRSNF